MSFVIRGYSAEYLRMTASEVQTFEVPAVSIEACCRFIGFNLSILCTDIMIQTVKNANGLSIRDSE